MRLIDADALLKDAIKDEYGVEHVLVSAIRDAPAIDAEPVRHGRWILNKHYADYECSICRKGDITAPLFKQCRMYYCPNCGAKMDLEVQDD